MTVTRIAVGGQGADPEAPNYSVVLGAGILGELPRLVGPTARQVAVICPDELAEVARPVCVALETAGYRVLRIEVPDGEGAKEISVAAQVWSQLGAADFTRTDVIVGVGGGATTDLAGFVAATWLRGVPVVLVPTTLLAMVDAAVGGKTGINTAEGKNLVGAFHCPAGVLCDLATLPSLPRADYVAGLAEIIKVGLIADPRILELVAADPSGASRVEGVHTRALIERAVAVKAEVVSGDFREAGQREILNYGHTLAHAIERAENYTFRHGDAVAIGMVFAAELAHLHDGAPAELATRTRDILTSVGLPTSYPAAAWPSLLQAMRRDKKARGASLRFVLLEDVGRPVRRAIADEQLLELAYGRVSG